MERAEQVGVVPTVMAQAAAQAVAARIQAHRSPQQVRPSPGRPSSGQRRHGEIAPAARDAPPMVVCAPQPLHPGTPVGPATSYSSPSFPVRRRPPSAAVRRR